MLVCFYDIESLSNAFTLCDFKPEVPCVDVYYLVDDKTIVSVPRFEKIVTDRILEKNRNFHGDVRFFDLSTEDANRRLAMAYGLSNARLVNDPKSKSDYPAEFRPVCDTDPDYDEDVHPYLMGYNSYNYDTTMLAMYLYEVFPVKNGKASFRPTTAKLMRECSDTLFLDRFKGSMATALTQTWNQSGRFWSDSNYQDDRWKIRKSMLMTGRHIDVARLNEKQQHVGLKRLIGMMGGQILESDKLAQGQDHIDDLDQLADLIAYNVSDCVNLKQYIFDNKVYQGQFFLKRGLLHTYPELVYEKRDDAYAPDVRPERVRRDRMTLDSSSAQLATKSLCPYGHLKDIPVVSFMYPSKRKAEELGIPQVNVLEEARKFFYKNFPQPELRAEFDRIYRYYKAIEGKNFNMSENYQADYGNSPDYHPPENITRYSKGDTCMFYYNGDGSPSSCFVTFSIGGIHGAEYNKALYEHDVREFEAKEAIFNQVRSQYPDPTDLKKAKTVTVALANGDIVTMKAMQFLKSGSTLKQSFYKDIEKTRPLLFKADEDGVTKLNPRYVFTSADPTNHEDFTSYYPNLLRMLSAFYNEGLGYDRYAEIFDNKQRYGFLMKVKNANLTPEQAEKYRDLREMTSFDIDPLHISDQERAVYDIQRDGTKLILNSASGAADANFESNIRMNNVIISMRIIGQIFSWRIGQAQTIEGARVTSTNTDGLFTVLDPDINNPVLERESRDINVEIEPEPTYLISKDSNNRIEMDEKTGAIQRASGGSLACRRGPDPQKSLAHPAIIDWALTEYLVVASQHYKGLSLSSPFDDAVGMNILHSASRTFKERHKLLQMFQNVIASSIGSMSYNFALRPGNQGVPVILQHYNRVFIMKDGTPDTVHVVCAAGRKIPDTVKKKRARDNERPQQHDPLALQVLNAHGVSFQDIGPDREAIVKKVTGIESDWFMKVCNRNLELMDQAEQDEILDNLDYDKYLGLLRDSFEANWRNTLPEEPNGTDPDSGSPATGDDAPSNGPQEPPEPSGPTGVSRDTPGTETASGGQETAPTTVVTQEKPKALSEMTGQTSPDNESKDTTAAPDPVPHGPAHRHTWANNSHTVPVSPEKRAELDRTGWPPSDDCPFDVDPPSAPDGEDAERIRRLNESLEECLRLATSMLDASKEQLAQADDLVKRIESLISRP